VEVVVARVGKPHGIRGEVTVQLHTDHPSARFVPGAAFATEAKPGSGVPHSLTLRTAREHNGIWLLAFDQIHDRTAAETLRGTRLVAPADRPEVGQVDSKPEEREEEGYYEDDLIGLTVLARDGARLGSVTGLEVGAAQDLLVVTLDTGSKAYLPFVAAIVPEVDLDASVVVVDPPDGLLELNAEG
jgi:16S rRNA processing protein RimM